MTFEQFLRNIESELQTLCDTCVKHHFREGIEDIQFSSNHNREVFLKAFRDCIWTVAMSAFAKGVQMLTPSELRPLLKDNSHEPSSVCH